MKNLALVVCSLLFVCLAAFGAKVGAEFYLASQFDQAIQKSLQESGKPNSMQYDSISVDIQDREVSINNVTFTDPKTKQKATVHGIRIGGVDPSYVWGVSIGDIDPQKDYPDEFYVDVDGLLLDQKEFTPEQQLAMEKLGYKGLLVSFLYKHKYNPDKKILDFHAAISAKKAGTLSFDLSIGNFDDQKFIEASKAGAVNPMAMMSPLMELTLVKAAVKFEDDSLVQRLDYLMYQTKKTTVAHSLQMAKYKKVKYMGPEAISPKMETYYQKLLMFAQKPRSISASIKPASPLNGMELVMGFANPEALLEKANFQLKANGS